MDTIKHIGQLTSLTLCSDLFLSCILFIQKSSSIFYIGPRLWQTKTWHICWRGKNVFRVRSSNLSQALRHIIFFFFFSQTNKTIITGHHLFLGHCVNSEVTVMDGGIFLRERSSCKIISRSKAITNSHNDRAIDGAKFLLSLITAF